MTARWSQSPYPYHCLSSPTCAHLPLSTSRAAVLLLQVVPWNPPVGSYQYCRGSSSSSTIYCTSHTQLYKSILHIIQMNKIILPILDSISLKQITKETHFAQARLLSNQRVFTYHTLCFQGNIIWKAIFFYGKSITS